MTGKVLDNSPQFKFKWKDIQETQFIGGIFLIRYMSLQVKQ